MVVARESPLDLADEKSESEIHLAGALKFLHNMASMIPDPFDRVNSVGSSSARLQDRIQSLLSSSEHRECKDWVPPVLEYIEGLRIELERASTTAAMHNSGLSPAHRNGFVETQFLMRHLEVAEVFVRATTDFSLCTGWVSELLQVTDTRALTLSVLSAFCLLQSLI